MAEGTSIGWTDITMNPWWGCVEVSTECDNCYAFTFARRLGKDLWGKHTARQPATESYWAKPLDWNEESQRQGRVRFGGMKDERIRVFCASMADVFETHPQLPPWRARLFDLIRETPYLDWQLLTKRPRSVQLMVPWPNDWPPNVWIGTSIGVAAHTWRANVLRQIPAHVRFISAEPLLESLFQGKRPLTLDGIGWLIAGGESGGNARPLNVRDVDDLIANAREHDAAVYVKQLGSAWARRVRNAQLDYVPDGKGEDWRFWPERLRIREFPASAAVRA